MKRTDFQRDLAREVRQAVHDSAGEWGKGYALGMKHAFELTREWRSNGERLRARFEQEASRFLSTPFEPSRLDFSKGYAKAWGGTVRSFEAHMKEPPTIGINNRAFRDWRFA